MSFVYITDCGADLNPQYFTDRGLYQPIPLEYTIGDVTSDYIPVQDREYTEYYDNMRNGATPKTSMANPTKLKDQFAGYLKEGKDVLYFALSSGVSGTYNGAAIACKELSEEFPERKVIAIDSLCASRGMGLLFNLGYEKMKAGASIDEVAAFLEENKYKLVHDFTVDDLVYLQRGGRVSKVAALAAKTLDLKPVMHVDNEGKLVAYKKVRGRKKAIKAMVENISKQTEGKTDLLGYICHGDCAAEAEKAKDLMLATGHFSEVVIDFCGVVIGSHSGPGTLALFTLGENREVE
ncbi:MAG: DegV family protein [Bacillota bacterium]